MALAKERIGPDSSSHINLMHLYGNMYGGGSISSSSVVEAVSDPSSIGLFGFENYTKMVIDDEGDGSSEEKPGSGGSKYHPTNRLPCLTDPTSNNVMFNDEEMNSSSSAEESHESVISFKAGFDHWMHSSGSLLSFGERVPVAHNRFLRVQHEDDDQYPNWEGVMVGDHQNYQWSHSKSSSGVMEARLSEDMNSFETGTSYGSMNKTTKDNHHQHGEERFEWLYSGGVDDNLQEAGCSETSFLKRPHMDGEMQANKKHCSGAPKKPKSKSPVPAKDPQSIAAKNRRERISERLKVLQDLVPNGSKVDLVTMLEKAISYVKFLQLQVKVLATDEFWPAQGGKAPEVSQVKEAIDAILCSHKEIQTQSDENPFSN